jgi:hypothetical protein
MKKLILIITLLFTVNSQAQFCKVIFPDSIQITVPDKDTNKNKFGLLSGIYKYKTNIDLQFCFSENNEQEPKFINLIGKNDKSMSLFLQILGIEDKNLSVISLVKTTSFVTGKGGRIIGNLYKIDTGTIYCSKCKGVTFLIAVSNNKIILFTEDNMTITFY